MFSSEQKLTGTLVNTQYYGKSNKNALKTKNGFSLKIFLTLIAFFVEKFVVKKDIIPSQLSPYWSFFKKTGHLTVLRE